MVVVIASANFGAAADVPLRSFSRFQYDSGSAHGLWVELDAANSHFERGEGDASASLDVDVIQVGPTLAYGGEAWEAGFIVPYLHSDATVCQPYSGGCSKREENGVGDIQTYGKYVWRSESLHLGGGLNLSLPSGDRDKGFGSGEVGVAPFATAALIVGPVEMRTHIGNLFYADDSSAFAPRDVLFYGGGLFGRLGEHLALRGEIVGSRLDRHDQQNWITFEPGVDVRIPLGAIDLLIRPTASVGLTEASPDWGVGGGIAISPSE
jgi:hypothetical protein